MTLVEVINQSVTAVRRWAGDALYCEEVYQRALTEELRSRGVHCGTELVVPVYYGRYQLSEVHIRPDIVCTYKEEKVIIELKRVNRINDNHRGQLKGYMKQMRIGIGILVNFPDGYEVFT